MSGLFITMEGTDGAGKSTQTTLLSEYLTDKGFNVLCTREPGGNKISEKIREIIIDNDNKEINDMTEALLYAAARCQLTQEVIIPTLKNGDVVICDRYIDSSIVYQGLARGIGEKVIYNINKYATKGLVPDITFFLKLNPLESLNRKEKVENLDRIESENFYFHKKVFNGYIELARKNSERIKIIDALKDVSTIHNDIVFCIDKLLNERSF